MRGDSVVPVAGVQVRRRDVDEALYRAPVVTKIVQELLRAKQKFPRWPRDAIHASAIIAEEVGELQQATLKFAYETRDGKDNAAGLRVQMQDEAVQVAAMAIRFLLNIGRYPAGYMAEQDIDA